MPWWFALLMFAASTVLGQLFRPKVSAAKPVTLADLDFPTAEETRSIPKGYGTYLMKAPNVVSVTDFSSEVIKSKVSTFQKILSFGMAKKQVIGSKYFVGMEMALCYRLDALIQINVGEKVAWTGNVTADSEIYINKPTLFGGDDPAAGGNGGLIGYLGVHVGSPTATKDAYLVSEYGNYSAHRNVCYVVWKGQHRAKGSGYIGNSTSIAPWEFVGRSIPNNLGTIYSNINSGDANPAEVLYDVLRNSEYAIGMGAGFIDVPSFQAAAHIYHTDGLGFSGLWDTSKPCKDIINNLLQLTDSVLYSDLQTGKMILKPARANYVIDDLPSYDDNEIISISSFTRGAWAETTNEVRVPFINRLDQFTQQTGLAQDLANQRLQGGATVSTNISHIGISNPDTAADVAQRDLRALTTPLAKVSFQVNLKGYKTVIGDPFRFSTDRILDERGRPITNMVMRCIGMKIGSPKNPVIDIEAIEDVFNSTLAVYATPPPTSGTTPSTAPVATSTHVLDEVPYMLADESARLWTLAAAPNAGTFSFDTLVSDDNTTYEVDDSNNTFAPTGLLTGNYSAVTAAKDTSDTLIINHTGAVDLTRLVAATAAEVANGKNMFLVIEGGVTEIMAYESYTVNGSGNYVLHNVWRGLLDTTPKAFTSAARAWFFSYGDARSDAAFLAGVTGYVKILTKTLQGTLDEGSAVTLNRVLGVRAYRPYAPGNIRINTVYNGSIPGTGDITVDWSHRDRTRQGQATLQNAGTVGLEGGASYTLRIYKQNGTLLRTASGLVGEQFIYTNVQEMADNGGVLADALTFVLFASRDGITSLQAQIRGSARTGSTIYAPVFAPSGTFVLPPAGNSTSIGGVPITGTPSGTNNTPVYDPVTGTISWQPGGGLPDLTPDPTGVYGSETLIPQITVDIKGRVTDVDEIDVNPAQLVSIPVSIPAGLDGFVLAYNGLTGQLELGDAGSVIFPTSWAPSDLSSIIHWYTADSITGASDGDPIGAWTDLIGTAHGSSSGSDRPIYKDGGGVPYLEFNAKMMTTAITDTWTDFTIIMVLEMISMASAERILDKKYDTGFWMGTMPADNTKLGGGTLQTGVPYGYYNTASAGNLYCIMQRRKTATSELSYWLNGTHNVASISTGALDSTALCIGAVSGVGDQRAKFKLYELIICNGSVADSDITTGFNSYASPKYGVSF